MSCGIYKLCIKWGYWIMILFWIELFGYVCKLRWFVWSLSGVGENYIVWYNDMRM